jgi:hypothetical protein
MVVSFGGLAMSPTPLPQFETRPCPRCNGSGTYSYCQRWGTTCFKCGTQPGLPGTGKVLSKRGLAAKAYERESLDGFKVPARELKPGGLVRMHATDPARRLLEILPASSWRIVNGVEQDRANSVDFKFSGITYSGVTLDQLIERVPPREVREEIRRMALDYQDTLTKAGTVRKRRSAA